MDHGRCSAGSVQVFPGLYLKKKKKTSINKYAHKYKIFQLYLKRASLGFENHKFSTNETNHEKVEAHLVPPPHFFLLKLLSTLSQYPPIYSLPTYFIFYAFNVNTNETHKYINEIIHNKSILIHKHEYTSNFDHHTKY
jgi:hypothetical protein